MATALIFDGLFFFNVSAHVGRGAPNKLDDVELVRYAYGCMRSNPPNLVNANAAVMAAMQAMKTTGPYAADLQAVIDAHQAQRGGTKDGKISPAQPNAFNNNMYDGQHSWMITVLSNNIRIGIKDGPYPRIDMDKRSGPEISKLVKAMFTPPEA